MKRLSLAIAFLLAASCLGSGQNVGGGQLQGGEVGGIVVVCGPVVVTGNGAFPSTAVGGSSASQPFTVANNGLTPFTLGTPTATTPFAVTSNTCGASLGAGLSCVIGVTFSPTVAGTATGTLAVPTSCPGSPVLISLSGTGTSNQPKICFSPTSLSFPDTPLGGASTLPLVITSCGSSPLTVTSTSSSNAQFVPTQNCNITLAVGATCTTTVTFRPAAGGAQSANITYVDNDATSPQRVAASGNGSASAVCFSPTTVAFGSQTVGVPSQPQNVTVSNCGSGSLIISSVTTGGTNGADFSVNQTNCQQVSANNGGSIPPGGTCILSVTFTPSLAAAETGSLIVASNAPTSPNSATLTGTGTPVPSPALNISTGTARGRYVKIVTSSAYCYSTSCTQQPTVGLVTNGAQTSAAEFAVLNSAGAEIAKSAPAWAMNNQDLAFQNPVGCDSQDSVHVCALAINAVLTDYYVTRFTPAQDGQPHTYEIDMGQTNTITALKYAPRADGCVDGTIIGYKLYISADGKTWGTPVLDTSFTYPNPGSFACPGGTPPPIRYQFLSPSSLTFGNQAIGSASPAQAVTITNSGSAADAISSIVATGDFSQTNTCGSSLAAGASCTISVTFTPTAAGTRTGSVTITDATSDSPHIFGLLGTGVPQAVTLVSIAVAPTAPSIAVGSTQQFTATGTFSDGSTQDLTNVSTWTSSNTVVATINSNGLATAIATGTTNIKAVNGSVTSNTAVLTAVAAPCTNLLSVAVTPSNPSVPTGTTQQFIATGTFNGPCQQDVTATATWTSANTAVATISNSPGTQGLATAVAAGSSTITATQSAISGNTLMTVTAPAPPVLQSIALAPASGATVSVGGTVQYAAIGNYSDGSTQDLTTCVSWTSSSTATATIGLHTGLATGVVSGSTTITATDNQVSGACTNSGLSASGTLTVASTLPATVVSMGVGQAGTINNYANKNASPTITPLENIHSGAAGTPGIPGAIRNWDSFPSTKWSAIQSTSAVSSIVYTGLDPWAQYSNQYGYEIHYSFASTPTWASANGTGTCPSGGSAGTCYMPSDVFTGDTNLKNTVNALLNHQWVNGGGKTLGCKGTQTTGCYRVWSFWNEPNSLNFLNFSYSTLMNQQSTSCKYANACGVMAAFMQAASDFCAAVHAFNAGNNKMLCVISGPQGYNGTFSGTGLNWLADLYCDPTAGTGNGITCPKFPDGTIHFPKGMTSSVDAVMFHGYNSGNNPALTVPEYQAFKGAVTFNNNTVLPSATRALPIWDEENAGWLVNNRQCNPTTGSTGGVAAQIANDFNGWMGQAYILHAALGIARFYEYQEDNWQSNSSPAGQTNGGFYFPQGHTDFCGLGLNVPPTMGGVAVGQTMQWLVASTVSFPQCTSTSSPTNAADCNFNTQSGHFPFGAFTVPITKPAGTSAPWTSALAVWNNNGTSTTNNHSFTVPSTFYSSCPLGQGNCLYYDLAGATHNISASTMNVGTNPVLLTNGGGIPASFFGMHENMNAYAAVPGLESNVSFGCFRLWDSGTRWAQLNPSNGNYDFSQLDAWLLALKSAGKSCVIFTFGVVPNWASSAPFDAHCDFGAQGGCDLPSDLNPDGTGTNAKFSAFVTALVNHVYNATYLNTHAKITAIDMWNEWFRNPNLGTQFSACATTGNCSIHATVPQMRAMTQVVRTAVKAQAPDVLILTPSDTHSNPNATKWLLYCTNAPANSLCPGTVASSLYDGTNIHTYVFNGAEPAAVIAFIENLYAILSTTDKAKPMFGSEGGWGTQADQGDEDKQAEFVPRYFLYAQKTIKDGVPLMSMDWYNYGTGSGGNPPCSNCWGILWTPNTGVRKPGIAFNQIYNWLVGAVVLDVTQSGTKWVANVTRSNGYQAQIVWDSGFVSPCANAQCGTFAYTAPAYATKWRDLAGATHTGAPTQYGAKAIIVESF